MIPTLAGWLLNISQNPMKSWSVCSSKVAQKLKNVGYIMVKTKILTSSGVLVGGFKHEFYFPYMPYMS